MEIFHIGLNHFLGLSTLLFGIGLYGLITRKNAFSWLIGLMLMISAISIILISLSRYQAVGPDGQVAPVLIIIVGSFQIAVAAAIILNYSKNKLNQK